MLPISEEMKALELIRKERKLHAEVAKIYDKNQSSICETLENQWHLSYFKL